VPAASILLKQINEAQPNPRLDDVLPVMEWVVKSVAEQVPHSVNKNVKAHIVVAPTKLRDHVLDGTRAAWDSVTMKTAAVDTSGNLILKNKVNAAGVTANPTQPNNTYAVIPEMTTTITTHGNKVLIIFLVRSPIREAAPARTTTFLRPSPMAFKSARTTRLTCRLDS